MAAPSLPTRTGALPQLVAPGRTGFLVDVENLPAHVDALAAILRDRPLAGRLGRNARSAFVTEPGLDGMVDAHERSLSDLASR